MVCVPVFQPGTLLVDTLSSIQRQTHDRFRAVISIDGDDGESALLCQRFVTDPRFRVAALVQRSRAQGIALGTSRGRLFLAYIAAPEALAVGDLVLTSGAGGVIPKGLVLGRIARVEPGPGGLYWQAQVAPAVNADALEEVLCLQ